jgi:hypothetical protein
VTQGVARSWHFSGGGGIDWTQCPQALYLSLGQEISFTPLCVGWHLAVWVFSLGITQEKRLKTPGPDLIGEGGISPYLILWRRTYPGWLSPSNGDLGFTQILTQHCGAKSKTISHLTNSGTMPARQVPVVQPI